MSENPVEIIVTATDKASETLRGIGESAKGLGGVLGGVLKVGLFGAAAGLTAVGAGIAASIAEATDAEKIQAQLATVLKSTKGAAGMTAESVNALADSLARVTPFEADTTLGAENMLLTFTSIGKEIFPQATETVLDMSTALGQDLKSSSIQLGKALNEPITGVTALQRVGVQFTEQQKEQIKTLVKSGDTLSAQKLILKELQTEFGGSAKAAGQTFGGQMQILQNSIKPIMETIGGAFLPALTDLAKLVNADIMPALKKWAEDAAPKIQAALKQLGAWLVSEGLPAFRQFAGWVKNDVIPALQQLGQWIQTTVLPAIRQLGDWIKGTAIPALQQLGKMFSDSGTQAQAGLGQIWTIVKPIVDKVTAALSIFWTEIQPKLTLAWQVIQDRAFQAWTFIHDNIIVPIVSAIQAFIEQHGAQLQAMWEDLWNVIGGVVQVAWDSISGIVKIALDLIGGDFDAAGVDFKTMMDGIWAGVKQITAAAWDWIKNLIVIAWDEISRAVDAKAREIFSMLDNMVGQIIASLNALPGELFQMGINIIQGLIDGLWNSAGNVAAALQSIVDDAINAIKRRLGIASPSQVFAQIGAQMAAGLGQGFGAPQLNFAGAIMQSTAGSAPGVMRGMSGSGGGIAVTFVYSPTVSLANRYEAQQVLQPFIEQGIIAARRKKL